jgi:hypothetical protein
VRWMVEDKRNNKLDGSGRGLIEVLSYLKGLRKTTKEMVDFHLMSLSKPRVFYSRFLESARNLQIFNFSCVGACVLFHTRMMDVSTIRTVSVMCAER